MVQLKSAGTLVIDNNAVVQANINMGTLIVGGTIIGNVKVSDRLVVLTGGCIKGNIRCLNLIMADDTSLQGKCEMLAEPDTLDIFSQTSETLKKSIERVGQ